MAVKYEDLFPAGAKPNNRPERYALGHLKPDERNRTEAAYETHLEYRRLAGEILWHRFHCINLRIAPSTFYRPDFMVMAADGVVEIHEVKGFTEEDSWIKIKTAADIFPFRFLVAKKIKGGWKIDTI